MENQSVLVEFQDAENERVFANSGFLFANRYVLFTPNVLMTMLKKQKNIKTRLQNLKPGLLNLNVLLNGVPRVNVVVPNDDGDVQYKQGSVAAMFISDDLRRAGQNMLRDWTIDYQETQYQFKEILSLFFIAQIDVSEAINFAHLTKCLYEVWADAKAFHVRTGQRIFIESTPFGNRNFLKSYSQGIISNVLGRNNSLILTDAPSAPGTEGGPIFVKLGVGSGKKIVFGVVISSLSWWKGEWIGLTLAANLTSLIEPLIGGRMGNIDDGPFEKNSKIKHVLDVLDNSIVRVISGTSWGTAVLLDKEKGIFITASHVIESDRKVKLHWNSSEIDASVIFKTNPTGAYDLAILAANKASLRMTPLKSIIFSTGGAQTGERVFAAGFPLFSKHENAKATLTSGHVSQVSPFMMKTTCSVLPGSSGGAILRADGTLIGVIVCNTKLQDGMSLAHPRINLAIPISAICLTIFEFLENEDVSVLQNLQVEDASINKQWNFLCSKL